MKTIEELKAMCSVLTTTAMELQEILSTSERDDFAIAFLQYVEDTYTKSGDRYYFKNPQISHVHRSAREVLFNFVELIYSNKQ